jgi:hypothetical protein
MSKRLEDFIRANKDQFDDLEPSADLWASIEKQLPAEGGAIKKREAKTFSLSFVLRVAAIIIVVMGIGFAWYLQNEKRGGVSLAAINPEYAKEQMHYASLVESQRTELRTLSKSDPELYREFSAQIDKMDAVYKKLNSELATTPNQEFVLRAMIRNLQVQTMVLSQQLLVIEQYNQMKKDQQNQNEIKNI